jgi:hypothetical protein
MVVHPHVAVELDTAHAHFFSVGQVAAKNADGGVLDLCLEVFDLGVVDSDVCGDAVKGLRLDTGFDVPHIFGPYGRSRQDRPADRIGWHASTVTPVLSLMTRTIAPGIAPPDESRTTPVIVLVSVPVPACASRLAGATRPTITTNAVTKTANLISFPETIVEFSLNTKAHCARIR